jgi:hypothetical protein
MLHWLDVQSQGQFVMNNVETSKAAIAKMCPELMAYFASGVRPSMYDLGLLHAAARCQRVVLRGARAVRYVRRQDEDRASFHTRLLAGDSGEPLPGSPALPENAPCLAVLYGGDLELPSGSSAYALFRERVVPTLTASDLLS